MQKYTGVVIDAKGSPMTGVTVTVNLLPGGSAATIYSDNGVTGKANPFTNDANGSFEFYAADGRYNIVLAKTGVTFVASDTSDISLADPLGGTKTILAFTNDQSSISTAGTYYAGGAVPFQSGDINAGKLPMAFAGVAKNLRCWVSGGLVGGSSIVFTLLVDGAATALTATIAAGQNTASDLTNTVNVSAGQLVQMRMVKTGTDNEDIGVTLEYAGT